jgi:hypothetical protein
MATHANKETEVLGEVALDRGVQTAPTTSEKQETSEVVHKCVETYKEVTIAVAERNPVIDSYA